VIGSPNEISAIRCARQTVRSLAWVVACSVAARAVTLGDSPPRGTPVDAGDSPAASTSIPPGARRFFSTHVEPVLRTRCFACHGAIKKKGELDLRTPESVLRGGERGPAAVPGDVDASRLVRFVEAGADPHMPPGSEQLEATEIAAIAAWVRRLDPGAGRTPAAEHAERWKPEANFDLADGASGAATIPLPRGVDPTTLIDLLIAARWARDGVEASARCDDETFVRRIHLDLIGRIPMLDERARFLAETSSAKRERLVDALLSSREHARYLREVFDVVWMGRGDAPRRRQRREQGWYRFLEESFHANRPWNEIVRAVIEARPESDVDQGATCFLHERRDRHQEIAEALAPAAFGLDIRCAQCHDHPIAPEILQSHYWGLVAFFARSKNVSTTRGPGVAESAIGGHSQFTDLSGASHDALLAFFDGSIVAEVRPAAGVEESDAPERYLVPNPEKGTTPERAATPRESRRERLAEIAASETPLTARAVVNRVWALLVGRGLVHPVDKMDSTHAASHPELLEWLGSDFDDSGHDLRRLIRAIVLSRAYQLECTPRSEGSGDADAEFTASADTDAPRFALDELFARGLTKPLSAEAFARSLLVATQRGLPEGDDLSATTDRVAAVFPTVFYETYGTTLEQVLFVSNNPQLDLLLAPRDGNTAAELLAIADTAERARAAFQSVLGREPDEAELARGVDFLDARSERATDGVRQLLWALVASAEFRLNH